MPDCVSCRLFQLESENTHCLLVNRPGGLELTRFAFTKCNLQPGSRVADIASGLGATLACIRDEYHLLPIGVDLSGPLLRQSRKLHPEISLTRSDCTQVPFANQSLDAVVMECALSLSGDTSAVLKEFQRVLKPDGALILSDIYIREIKDPESRRALQTTHCLSDAITRDDLSHLIEREGFHFDFWEDQTVHLKQWMARMVFELGSFNNFYRQLVASSEDACQLESALGNGLKLGYYLGIASKMD
jgi:arsenite methyltransferase